MADEVSVHANMDDLHDSKLDIGMVNVPYCKYLCIFMYGCERI